MMITGDMIKTIDDVVKGLEARAEFLEESAEHAEAGPAEYRYSLFTGKPQDEELREEAAVLRQAAAIIRREVVK